MTATVAQPSLDVTTWSRRVAMVTVVGLTLGAWAVLAAWSTSAHDRYLDHDGLAEGALSPAATVAVFVVGWVVMLVAMMLPSTHSLVATFARVVGSRPDRGRLLGLLLLGYLAAWTGVGLAALALDQVVHALADSTAVLDGREWVVGATVVVLAGIYQFSPVKDRCLSACRSPQTFVFTRWRGRNAASESFALGAAHAKFCVGCCAALMLLMFAVGMGNLGWMFLLGAVMTVEKVAPRGDRLVAPVGVALFLIATGIVLVQL